MLLIDDKCFRLGRLLPLIEDAEDGYLILGAIINGKQKELIQWANLRIQRRKREVWAKRSEKMNLPLKGVEDERPS